MDVVVDCETISHLLIRRAAAVVSTGVRFADFFALLIIVFSLPGIRDDDIFHHHHRLAKISFLGELIKK